MKKQLFYIIGLLPFASATAQTLYTDDFDNYTIGNLGTDTTGQLPGQGGWYTHTAVSSSTPGTNAMYQVVSEATKGAILQLGTFTSIYEANRSLYRTDLNTYWQQRTPSNNVLKFSYEIYTGNGYNSHFRANLYSNEGCLITYSYRAGIPSDPNQRRVGAGISVKRGEFNFGFAGPDLRINGNPIKFPNAWVTLECYIDYNTSKVYFYVPSLNHVTVKSIPYNLLLGGFDTEGNPLPNDSPVKLEFWENKTTSTSTYSPKIDNINLTALSSVPTQVLEINQQLGRQFNMYPNPASNVVNITSKENLPIEEVVIYNVTGKQISSQTFDNQTDIRLNVENLASGTYLLHLQTAQGTAVKNLVKK